MYFFQLKYFLGAQTANGLFSTYFGSPRLIQAFTDIEVLGTIHVLK